LATCIKFHFSTNEVLTMLDQTMLHDTNKLALIPPLESTVTAGFGSDEVDSKSLLAAATEFFESMGASNSREFLAKHRQTGGE
jgi:hypothetical protein